MARETNCKACGGWHDPMERCPRPDQRPGVPLREENVQVPTRELARHKETPRAVAFDRTAYQREYMRKWRKAKKGE